MANTDPASGISGALLIEVNTPTIVAGARGTVTLVIGNPFGQEIEIRSIEAPSSEPLLPRSGSVSPGSDAKSSTLSKILSSMSFNVAGGPLGMGTLTADFSERRGRSFTFDAQAKAKIHVKEPLLPNDVINVRAHEDAEVVFDSGGQAQVKKAQSLKIPPHQEDIALIELCTAHWLFVTPKVLNLHAVIRYSIGGEQKSQVVPMSLTVRPPLPALILGSLSGALLGFGARQLTSPQAGLTWVPMLIGLLGVMVMSVILAIVLSRDSGTKGFVTLEDFYGAFIVGVVLGYTGTSYFDGFVGELGNASSNAAANAAANAH